MAVAAAERIAGGGASVAADCSSLSRLELDRELTQRLNQVMSGFYMGRGEHLANWAANVILARIGLGAGASFSSRGSGEQRGRGGGQLAGPHQPAMALRATPSSTDAEARSDQPQGDRVERRPHAFYSSVFAQIEEVGWERLVSATGDDGVSCLTFRVMDEQGRHHLLEITLPLNYPACPPSIAADVPYLPKLQWSKGSRLKDVLCQFQEHLKILQEYWFTMDDIDKALWVVDPTKPTYAMSHRRIALGDDCYILLHIDARMPSSLPECRFLGIDGKLEKLIKNWRKNRKIWSADKRFHENLSAVLDFALLPPPSVSTKDEEQADCGICYAKHLPVDDELGTQSGCATDYMCENSSCSRAFHSVCLRDWLRTITTTRQSFDVLFGNCPYCSEPVAVKITDR